MKIKSGFILKNIADSYIVVPLKDRLEDFSAVINLNETGAFLWEKLEDENTRESLIDALLNEYDVSKDIATRDVDKFISNLQDNNILEA